MIVETNTPSVQKQLNEANDRDAARDRRNERLGKLFSPKQKAAAAGLAAVATIGLAGAVERGFDADRSQTPIVAENDGQAPRQMNPSEISTHETTPSTTMVTVGENQGPYQVVSGAVEQGIVKPEDAAAAQADVQSQYDAMPGGTKHPNDQVSVQISQ